MTNEYEPVNYEDDEEAIKAPTARAVPTQASTLLPRGQALTKEEEELAGELRLQLALQLGIALKQEYADFLVQNADTRSVKRFKDYFEFDIKMRAQTEGWEDWEREEFAEFSRHFREKRRKNLVSSANAAWEAMLGVIETPLRSAGVKEEITIEQVPNLLTRFFGGQKITKTSR